MSSSINRVVISGNLGKDVELKATPQGTQVASFSVCVNTRQKSGNDWKDKANWVECVFFGNRAEAIAKYLHKGSHVTVSGRINQDTWKDKNGNNRSRLNVIGDDIDFAGNPKEEQQTNARPGSVPPAADVYDEDIPF